MTIPILSRLSSAALCGALRLCGCFLLVLSGTVGTAAELAWPADADGAVVPAGWELGKSPDAKGGIAFSHGSLVLTGDTVRHCHLSRALGGLDGTDQAPLRIDCRIAVDTAAELGGLPTTIALYWGPTSAIGVGIAGWSQWAERWEPWRRRGWACWLNGAERGTAHSEGPFYGGAIPAYFRLVVTTRDVSAYASQDGLRYQALASFERKPGQFAGPPERLIVGRGWVGDRPEQQKPLLANDVGDPAQAQQATWTVSDLAIATSLPALPALPDYRKPKSWEEARDAAQAASLIRRWSLLGPLPPSDKPYGPESALDLGATFKLVDGKEGRWTPLALDDNANASLNLKALMKMTGENQIGFAAATITVDAERDERFYFDGVRRLWLYVNGRLAATSYHDHPELIADHYAATVRLRKGENQVLVKVASHNWDARCMFSLRHEPASPTARIAWLRRLVSDLGEDVESTVAAHQEIARLWESQGLLREAAEALAPILDKEGATATQVDAACFERARLHRLLGDRDAVIADVQELAKRRLAAKSDPREALASQLTVARLWEQMGFPDKGLEAIAQLQQDPAATPELIIESGLARARLHQLLKQDDQVPDDLAGSAKRLPDGHPAKFEIQLQALAFALAAGKDGGADALLKAIEQDKQDRDGRLARLHNLLAGASEARGDAAGRLRHLGEVIAHRRVVESSWESLHVEYAEGALAAGKGDDAALAVAIDHYRQALALCAGAAHPLVQAKLTEADQAGGKSAAALQALRGAYARACLAESPAGERLLQRAVGAASAATAAPAGRSLLLTPLIRDFDVIGPFDNPDWAAYAKPPVVGGERGKVDITKEVAGKKWIKPGLDSYQNGVLDLMKVFAKNDCVAFVHRRIDATAAFDGELSCGADDGLVVWFNGKKVHEDREQRAARPGDMVIPVHFEAGANTLLAMVQQGAGDWGVTISVNSPAAQSMDLGQTLALIERSPEGRPAVAAALGEIVDGALKASQPDEALAVARLMARAFPERPELQLATVDHLLTPPEKAAAPHFGPELVEWIDAYSARRGFADKERWLAGFRPRAAEGLRALGDLAGAAAMLRRVQLTAFDSDVQTQVLVGLGELYRLAGYPRTAADYFRRASERPIGDDGLRKQVRDGLFLVRGAKSDNAAFEASLDAGTMVQTADRAVANGDLERGLRTYQRAVDAHGTDLFKLDASKVVGIAEYVADRLHALDADALAAYRRLFDGRAKELFAQAQAAGDAGLFEQVARSYPGSSVAADALVQAAGLHLDGGAPRRAAAALTRALAGLPAGAARAPLLAKLAYAHVQAGDWAPAHAALDQLAAPPLAGADLLIRGKPVKAEAFVAELRKALAAGEQAGQAAWPSTGGGPLRRGVSAAAPLPASCRFETIIPVHPADQIAADRFAPAPWQHLMLQAACDGRTAYLHSLDESFAIDLATGALRWRSPVAFPALRRAERQDAFAGLPETMASVADGRVFGRALHREGSGSAFAVEARDAATGALRWSSETNPATADASAVSSPAVSGGTVVAVFQYVNDRSHTFAAAFAAVDGRLLWRTPLAFGLAALTLTSQQEIYLGDHLAAPSIAGGDVYLATDMGSVVALDLGNGALRWAATYPRALLDPVGSREAVRQLADRAASRVVVGDTLIYAAPRDTLAVLAIDRANGDIRWRQELSDARALVGLAGQGAEAGLIAQGRGVECLGALGGERRWRWSAAGDDQLWGNAAIGGDSVYVATRGGLARLAAADGRLQGASAWAKLGLEAPIGNLVLLNDVVLGVGNDRLVALQSAAGGGHAKVVVAGAAADPILPSNGLPAAEFAPPLALRWRLGSGANCAILQGGDGDGLYLDLGDRLVRMKVGGAQLEWETSMAPGLLRLEVAERLLLAVYPRSIVAFDNASGRMLWTHPLAYDDPGFFVDSENGRENRHFSEVAASATTVAVWRHGSRQVELLDARSGETSGSVDFPAELRWMGIVGAEIAAVMGKGERTWIEGRDPRTGAQAWTQDLPAIDKGQRHMSSLLSPDRAVLYLCGERGMVGFDLAQKKVLFNEAAQFGDEPALRLESGLLVATSHVGDSWRNHAIDAKSGKLAFDGEYCRGWRPYLDGSFRFAGDHAFGLSDQRPQGRITAYCRSLSANKELWSADLGDSWRHRCVGCEIAGRSALVIQYGADDQRLRYSLFDLDSGALVGEGPLPGQVPDKRDVDKRELLMPTAFVGGQLLYACRSGVIAVGGLPPAPPGRKPLDAALDQVRAAAAQPGREREGACEFTAIYRPDLRPALFTRQPLRIDGHLDDWAADEAIELKEPLDVRLEPGGAWDGPKDLSARARVAWDHSYVYLAVETTDDRHQEPAPGGSPLDGDGLVIGFDPDVVNGGGEERRPIVLALSLVDGRTRVTQLSGRAVETVDEQDDAGQGSGAGQDDKASARIVRGASGCVYELAIPWSVLRPNPGERPGNKTTMGLGLAVVDWDAGRPRAALEWGYGLVRGTVPSSFGQIAFIDLTPERIASYRKFIELMPTHEFAWRFMRSIAGTHLGTAGLPGRIAEIEGFVKANPTGVHAPAALAELARLYRLLGDEQAVARTAQLATQAKVVPRLIGDGLGPGAESAEQGRAIRQWVWLDAAHPPREIMLQVRTATEDWHHRAYWGQDVIQVGEPATAQRWPLGPLPATGKWVALTVPIAALHLDGQLINGLGFAYHGGMASWGRSEFVEDGKARVLVDGAVPAGSSFDRVQWSDQPAQDGKKSHTMGNQAGDIDYHVYDGAVQIDLRAKATPDAAATKERLTRNIAAAKLIPETEEAMQLLREAEALAWDQPEGQRTDAVVAMYADFLKAYPANRQAARVLTTVRILIEGWSDVKKPAPPKRDQALARCIALADEAKLGREPRREFFSQFSPTIPEWKVLGFFDAPKGAQSIQEALPPERGTIDLDERYTTARGAQIGWSDAQAEWNALNLGTRVRDHEHHRWGVAYAYTRLEAPASAEALLYIGIKGQCAVWINGKRSGAVITGDRQFQRDAFTVPCKLVKGINEILIKATDAEGAPLLSCRVADLNGRPVEGLVPRLPPSLSSVSADTPVAVAVAFSGPVEQAGAEDPASYAIDRGIAVTAVALGKDRRTATLTVSPLAPDGEYTLTVGNVKSLSGTPIRAGSRSRFHLLPAGVGSGLKGEFFEGRELKDLIATRVDETIDFTYNDGDQPDPAVHANNFSVRWSGQVMPLRTDTWTFSTISDDGVRLWVDGKLLFDNWTDHGDTENTGTIALEAGKRYDIKLEYFQGGGPGTIKLMWQCGQLEREVVPKTQLFPGAAPAEPKDEGKKKKKEKEKK